MRGERRLKAIDSVCTGIPKHSSTPPQLPSVWEPRQTWATVGARSSTRASTAGPASAPEAAPPPGAAGALLRSRLTTALFWSTSRPARVRGGMRRGSVGSGRSVPSVSAPRPAVVGAKEVVAVVPQHWDWQEATASSEARDWQQRLIKGLLRVAHQQASPPNNPGGTATEQPRPTDGGTERLVITTHQRRVPWLAP